MYNKILTVTAVNNYIKKVIDTDFILKNTHISGELSNVKIHSSGHIYFSLKDNFSKIKGVMFRSRAINLKFIPRDGMQVVIGGNVSVYEKEGTYQLYCDTMETSGEGELYLAYNQLKARLEKEGLFAPEIKKEIPLFPERIGVVTSPTGAAVKDIIRVATHRNPKVNILIYPSLVQGIDAPADIARGIKILDKKEDVDLIIVARGGGSIEELWAFNEEVVARAIAASDTPVVSGVGHETDFTIADFTADYRAATPSHAAEVSTFNYNDMEYTLERIKEDITENVFQGIKERYNYISDIHTSIKQYSPENFVINQYDRIDNLKEKLNYIMRLSLQREQNKMQLYCEKLISGNPLNILKKGYGILEDEKGKTIETINELERNPKVKVIMKDGSKFFYMKGAEK